MHEALAAAVGNPVLSTVSIICTCFSASVHHPRFRWYVPGWPILASAQARVLSSCLHHSHVQSIVADSKRQVPVLVRVKGCSGPSTIVLDVSITCKSLFEHFSFISTADGIINSLLVETADSASVKILFPRRCTARKWPIQTSLFERVRAAREGHFMTIMRAP